MANAKKYYLAVFCICGFIFNYIAFNPGFLTPDSLDQYAQSLSGNYGDWHPPVMAFLWHLLNKIHKGPQLMLMFQLSCLWASGYLLADTFKSYLWHILIVLLLFAPFVQNFAGYIIKDSEMALCWLLAFAIMFRAFVAERKMSITEAVLSLLLITYGAWVRPNALPGCIPLCFLWVWISFYHAKMIWKATWVFLFFICIVTGQWLFTTQIIKPQKQHAENKLFIQDLTGIFVKTSQNVFPGILYSGSGFDTGYLRKKYHPATFDDIWWNSDGVNIAPAGTDEVSHELFMAWKAAIIKYPYVYLENRFYGFEYYLRIKKRTDFFCNYPPGITPNKFGIAYHENRVSGIASKVFLFKIWRQLDMPYMRSWFWFFLNFLLLVFAPLIKSKKVRLGYNILVLSGILYEAPSFFIYQSDTDFRYFYWNCISCTLAVCMFIAARFSESEIDKNDANI